MTPEDRAAKLCAALIREHVLTEDSASHHAVLSTASRVFAEWDKADSQPDPIAARYLDRHGKPERQ